LDIHPNVIRTCGTDPHWCRGCNYHFWRYAPIWTDDLRMRIDAAKQSAHMPRRCDFCGVQFNLIKHFYSSRSFQDEGMVSTTLIGNENFSLSHAGVDFLYPNLFLHLCPECFGKSFQPGKLSDHDDTLQAIRDLASLTGKLPTQDFDSYLYLFDSPESIRRFIEVMFRLPSPNHIKSRFGSFFAAIARSGLLPEGARRMKIGTMVMADDGDLCFSLVEREIDNFLFRSGIAHRKEVKYPIGDFRTDWELFGFSRRVFVEYFGLLNNSIYADKAKKKAAIAQEYGIQLIELSPDMDWQTRIRETVNAS